MLTFHTGESRVSLLRSYAIVGVVVAGGTWYLTRLARGPHGASSLYGRAEAGGLTMCAVVWTKDNPTPWNDIKPDENTKLLTVNQHFEKKYVSSALICSWACGD